VVKLDFLNSQEVGENMFNINDYKPLDITTDLIFEQLQKMQLLDYSYTGMIQHITSVNFLTWLTKEIEARYSFTPDRDELFVKLQLVCQFRSVKKMFNSLQ